MLGRDLLVAPVFSAEGDVSYYLPEGRWTRLLPALGQAQAEVVEGGRWIREKHGFMSMPLFARPGSIIPVGAVDSKPDYDYASGTVFHVFEPVEGAQALAVVVDLGGQAALSCSAALSGRKLAIRVTGRTGRYKAILHGAKESVLALEAGKEFIVDLG
jgi:alpha-D-xyloside xylohydrolase